MSIRRVYANQQPGGFGWARVQKTFGGQFQVKTTDLVTGNSVAFCIIPPDFVVTSLYGAIPKMDNGTALMLSVGVAGNLSELFGPSSLGQAGGVIPVLYGSFNLKTPGITLGQHTEILLTASTGAATPVAGLPTIYIDGFLGP